MTVHQALAAHKDSLERLYIVNIPPVNLGKDTGLTHFREILADHFFTSVDFLDMFFASLEQLVIAVKDIKELLYESSLRTILLDLATACRLRTPLLKGIVVWLPQEREELFNLDIAA
jgi:hypothetical protein